MARTRWTGSRKRKLKSDNNEEIITEVTRPWGDLDYNLLQEIFRLLPAEDLLLSVSFVCHNWRAACGEALFWEEHETLDVTKLDFLFGFGSGFRLKRGYDDNLGDLLKCVMKWEGHQRCVRNIIFPPQMELKDWQLDVVADRSPKLRKLVLPGTEDLTAGGVSNLLYSWKELEDLSIGPLEDNGIDGIFRTMGSVCKNLTRLHIFGSFSSGKYFRLNEDNASIIASNLVQLRFFSIDKAYMYQSGVQTLLSESENLLDLNLIRCSQIIDPVQIKYMDLNLLRFSQMIDRVEIKFIRDNTTVEIKRCCRVRNRRRWSASQTGTIYTAEDLVNLLWTQDLEVITHG